MRRFGLGFVLLVACGGTSPDEIPITVESTADTFQWHEIGNGAEVAHLQVDGVDCVVVVDDFQAVAVDCDWSER